MSDADDAGAERRRHPRTPLNVLVQYRFDTFDDFLAEYATNLSPSGIFIRTDAPREEGAVIFLQFTLKDGSRLIEGMGKVVRVNEAAPRGMGIEFVSVDDESMALILEVCAQRSGPRH